MVPLEISTDVPLKFPWMFLLKFLQEFLLEFLWDFFRISIGDSTALPLGFLTRIFFNYLNGQKPRLFEEISSVVFFLEIVQKFLSRIFA